MTNSLIIHTDGGARGNPGPAATGVVIQLRTGNLELRTIGSFGKTIGETTNNVAEYRAVITALEWVVGYEHTTQNSPPSVIQFFLDSSLVVNQLNGLFKINKSNLRDLMRRIRQLEGELGIKITYNYVPREQNKEADREVNRALDNSFSHVRKGL